MARTRIALLLLACGLLHSACAADHEVDEEMLRGMGGGPRFEDLSPEEAEKEINRVIASIDADGDGSLSRDEFMARVIKLEEDYISRDLEDHWSRADSDGNGFVTLSEYRTVYEPTASDTLKDQTKKKFKLADTDSDEKLTKSEFEAFLHPDHHKHMQIHLIDEHLARHDTNKDGFIDFDEYIVIYAPQSMEPGAKMPELVEAEKQEFEEDLDIDHDGRLDREEVRAWLSPDIKKFASEEADHLLNEMDDDKDGKLSKEEIASNFDIILDSEVTGFGHSVQDVHDEL